MVDPTSIYKQGIVLLLVLLFSQTTFSADRFQPMGGSYRPPAARGNAAPIPTPSQQDAWSAAQAYDSQSFRGANPARTQTYTPPAAYPANDSFNRSLTIDPGNLMNDIFGFNSGRDYTSPHYYNWSNTYPYPSYPYQGYGQGYSQSYTPSYAPATQQPPRAVQPVNQNQMPKYAAPERPLAARLGKEKSPYINRSAVGRDSRFRPPELTGTP